VSAHSVLHVNGLSFHRGSRVILNNLEIAFAPGTVTAVLGPNGAGKSTLLGCMAGLLTPAAGHVRVGNEDLQGMAGASRARTLALLPQASEIAWPIDVETFVALGRIPHQRVSSMDHNRAAIERALFKTDIANWRKRVVTELSGGERARVLLARVLATESEWILADEPFTGLDPSHQFEAAELLRTFATDGGVILTIHDLSFAARIADRIVLLHEGSVVADAPPTEALSATNLRDVYGVEAEWLIASSHSRTPIIAIHGRHAS
jgi:iron complex transport system ATP-binding protein